MGLSWLKISIIFLVSIVFILSIAFFVPPIRNTIRTEYLKLRYPVIPESELTVGSNYNQTTLSDGSTYFVSNGRQFYVKGVKTRVVFPDGREETRYLGRVTLLPQGQVVDLEKRQIAISQGEDSQVITIPANATIVKQTIFSGGKSTNSSFSEVTDATLTEIRAGDNIQLIEGNKTTLLIIKIEQK